MKQKNKHAQQLAALRNKALSPERRKQIAKLAATARWGQRKGKP